MKITWTPNPLRTIVELDAADLWWLREAMVDDYGDEMDDPEWSNGLHADYVAALADEHLGDCVCSPCSCLKCHAEDFLGINTIAGLRKYQASHIRSAFGNDGDRSLDEAIAALANWTPKPWKQNRETWESCLPRWREEAAEAHAWLVAYRDRHFPKSEV